MNSSLQVLYMNPILRQTIYDLPLCTDDDIAKPSDLLDKNQKYEILIAIQKLFCQLQYLNIHSISTLNLTEAFKWECGEGANQQDCQEFIRLFLFDILERILLGTPYDGYINNMYKIITRVSMQCSSCSFIKSREDDNFDIVLPVKNLTGIQESLNQLFCSEEIINDYNCENCKCKVDLKKSAKINYLPIFLNFPLNRFDFDFETMERIKITSRFEFPLELNMKNFMSRESLSTTSEDEFKYELYAFIVHRGTPYSGHYFSYVRDMNKEGNWEMEEVKDFVKEPEIVKEKEDIKENENGSGNIIVEKNEENKKNSKKNCVKNNGKNNNQQNKAKKKSKFFFNFYRE